MWKFANLEIKDKAVLAPMAGITSFGYRKFMSQFGFSMCYTEMVSDMGLIYKNKETEEYVEFEKGNYFTGVQLFGNDPENIKNAAKIALNLNKHIDFFDVNMACPVPKVNKSGAGCSLMKDPKKCGEIIKAIKSVTSLPVSAKIRLGYDDNHINYLEVIEELEKAGVDMIAIHARSAKQLYSGEPRFEILKDLRDKMSVPLLISGNIYSLDDAINAINITKADGVLVARGGVGNPYLLTQINRYYEDGTRLEPPSLKEQAEYCLTLAKEMINDKGEDRAIRIFRSIAPKFFSGYPNSKELRLKLSSEIYSYKDLNNIINSYIISLEN